MSRTIKFRAWDGKKIIYYTLDDLMWVLSGAGTISPYPNKQHLRDLMEAWEGDNSEAIKQQFTGLCDKTGREIYEGDILKASDGSPCEVRWVDFKVGFFATATAVVIDPSDWKAREVIGNQWENPELLNPSPGKGEKP